MGEARPVPGDRRWPPPATPDSLWGHHSITFNITKPRPWWRRLLRLPAKRITRGPYRIERIREGKDG